MLLADGSATELAYGDRIRTTLSAFHFSFILLADIVYVYPPESPDWTSSAT
jgi:hypothetical protein